MTASWVLPIVAYLWPQSGPAALPAGPAQPGWSVVSAGDTQACVLDTAGSAVCFEAPRSDGRRIAGGPRFVSIAVGLGLPCGRGSANGCADPGASHVCALSADARAWCWGDNRYGQLGDGTTVGRAHPTAVLGSLRFQSIRAGRGFTCGIADATAYCWGFNGHGNLGIGDTAGVSTRPRVVARDARAIEAAGDFACALRTDGLAYCWGADYHGRLGSDAATSDGATLAPVPVNGVTRFTALSARGDHVCGLTQSGRAWCWGSNLDGQLGADPLEGRERRSPADTGAPPLLHITTGVTGHTCGIAHDARAWCWGRNTSGELGAGPASTTSCFALPCVPQPTPVATEERFRSLSAGHSFTCGVTEAAELFCWGRLPWSAITSALPVRVLAAQPDTLRR